jgi:glycosyltransferase involved in cell wall biosynthesis
LVNVGRDSARERARRVLSTDEGFGELQALDRAGLRVAMMGSARNRWLLAGWDAWASSFARTLNQTAELLLSVVHGAPRVVLLGRTRIDPSDMAVFERKLRLFEAQAQATVVGTGKGLRRIGATRLIGVPWSATPLIGGPAFYVLGPVLATLWAAGRSSAAIVCQSPFEAAGCIVLRVATPARFRPRVVVEVHGDWRATSRLYGSWTRRLLAPAADKVAGWAVRRADRVRTVSGWLEALVRDVGFSGESDRFPTFSDFRAFLGPEPSRPPGQPIALYIGALSGPKGLDVLLKAWRDVAAQVPDARLCLVGEGPLERELRDLARRLGIAGSVSFEGGLASGGVRAALDRSSLLVLPSRSEGMPRVVLEALSRARPVVASRIGGIPEMIQHGRTGLLLPPGDAHELAKALAELLWNRERLRRMGDEGRRFVAERDPAAAYEAGVDRLAAWIKGDSGYDRARAAPGRSEDRTVER